MQQDPIARRSFLKTSLKTGAALAAAPAVLAHRGVNDRIGIACVGVGTRGIYLLEEFQRIPKTDVRVICDLYQGNVQLIRACDGVIAHLCAFRGLEPDSGTVFEVGYAVALGKPVVGYGVAPGSYAQRVAAALPCRQATDGHLRETANGAMVEGLGQRLNLMLTRSTPLADSAEA